MLVFNLKKEWFEKIKSGEKTHEYRLCKPYWCIRIKNYFMFSDFNFERLMNGAPFIFKKDFYIIFRCGYNGETIKAKALTIELVNGLKTDLKVEKLVFDIEFELIKENACQI